MGRQNVQKRHAQISARSDGSLRLAVIADTHSAPHPKSRAHVAALVPDAVLHAGDIGHLSVLATFEAVAPLFAVRGNIDGRAADLPDVLTLDILRSDEVILRILLLHIAVNGPRLRADAKRLARAEDAALVVCGHSHVPLIARDDEFAVFNPGSIGPRRFELPILFGVIDITPEAVKLFHFDANTGLPWHPSSSRVD